MLRLVEVRSSGDKSTSTTSVADERDVNPKSRDPEEGKPLRGIGTDLKFFADATRVVASTADRTAEHVMNKIINTVFRPR